MPPPDFLITPLPPILPPPPTPFHFSMPCRREESAAEVPLPFCYAFRHFTRCMPCAMLIIAADFFDILDVLSARMPDYALTPLSASWLPPRHY
jgi:hypothetical protein